MTNAKITMAAFVALAAVLGACQSVSATSEGGVQQGARVVLVRLVQLSQPG